MRTSLLCLLLAVVAMFATPAPAAPLFEEIATLSTAATPAQSDPITLTTAGTYTLALTDLGAQLTPAAPLASVELALTADTTVVATLSAAGSTQVTLAAGTYVIRVAGIPSAQPGSGLFAASLTLSGAAQPAYSFSGALNATGSLAPSHVQVYQGGVILAAGGSYTADLVDLSFPAALSTLTLIITAPGAAAPAALLPTAANGVPISGSGGTFSLFALGDSPAATNAGAFLIRIRDASQAIVYSQVVTVGQVATLNPTSQLAAGSYTLSSADLQFPAPLTGSGVLLVDAAGNGASVTGSASAPLSVAAPDIYQVLVYAATAGAGALGVELRDAGQALHYSAVQPFGGDSSSGTPLFAYPVSLNSAGSYVATLTDLKFTAPLAASAIAVAQGNTLAGHLSGPGTLPVTLAVGTAVLLLSASPASAGGSLQQNGGLASVQLALASGSAVFQTTQGVGGVANTRTFAIISAGDYRFSALDLQFPAPFSEFVAAVTLGSQLVGSVYGSGTFDVLGAQPGTYYVSFIARPDATAKAGTYAIVADVKPPNPAITLTASPLMPTAGNSFALNWSVQNATSCTASGAWSGALAASGSQTIAGISTATTYKLTCTGSGGNSTASLTVTPTAASSGGGGALDGVSLGALAAALAASYRRRRPRVGDASG